jgi:ABC-type branched-subunit amino acid transport system ATPase component
MTMENILDTRDLSISFGGIQALDGIDFYVSPGEVVGLIGPNGSGKTTFFNLLSGIYKPTRGDVIFRGKNITRKKPHQINRQGMARTFQTNRLFWQLSVLDNIVMGTYNQQKSTLLDVIFRYGRTKKELAGCVDTSLELLRYFSEDLGENPQRSVLDLSQGDRRRVEICRALASNPQLLLLDEPSAGMSPDETEKLVADIKKVTAKYKDISIIFIEHDMDVIESIAQRVIVFNYGQKLAEGTFAEIAGNQAVLDAYLGEDDEDA